MNTTLNLVDDGHLGGYARGGDPGTWCPHLWRWAIERFQVQSVLDVGCGEGWSTRFFAESGCTAQGLEGSPQAILTSAFPDGVVQHDLCQGPYAPDHAVDLVWSCEFVEHVEECYLAHVLETLTTAAKAILLTHAFPGQRGHHHVNCQPNRYWIRRIEQAGFDCDMALSREARTVSLSDYHSFNHFARSGLVFVRRPPESAPAGSGPWQARVKEWRIGWGFRLSAPYREQLRKKRSRKRAHKSAAKAA